MSKDVIILQGWIRSIAHAHGGEVSWLEQAWTTRDSGSRDTRLATRLLALAKCGLSATIPFSLHHQIAPHHDASHRLRQRRSWRLLPEYQQDMLHFRQLAFLYPRDPPLTSLAEFSAKKTSTIPHDTVVACVV